MTNAPETLEDLQRDLDRALGIMDARRAGYVAGREYYDGTRAEVFASVTVRKLLTGTAEATPISLAHIPVDVIADKIELASVVADGAAADPLAAVIDGNELEDESDDIIRKACYFGDYYAIVDPTVETEQGDVDIDGIRIVGSSPLNTVMVYDPRDERTELYGVKVWADGKRWRALLFYNDATVKLITDEVSDSITLKGDLFGPDLAEDETEADRGHYIEHEGGRILLVHLAVDSKPYGTPVHKK